MPNWHEGLKNLANSLGGFANYYAALEEREWQERRDRANQMFQERLLGLQQAHSEKMAGMQIAATKEEGAATRQLTRDVEASRLEAERSRWKREDARHAESMALQRRQLELSERTAAEAAKDRDLSRRVSASQGILDNVTSQINSLIKSRNKELENTKFTPERAIEIEQEYARQLEPLIEKQKELTSEIKALSEGAVDDPMVEDAVAEITSLPQFASMAIDHAVVRKRLRDAGYSAAQINEVLRQLDLRKPK